MFNLVKKDFLSISKNKNDLIELLFMPLILVIILGFALGNVLSGETSINTFSIGIVNEQNAPTDLERLENALINQDYPEETISQFIEVAEETNPTEMLTSVLSGDNFEELLVVDQFEDGDSAEEAMMTNEIIGYITFPEDFNYNLWQNMLLAEDTQAELDVHVVTEDSFYGNILTSILSSFIDEYNLEVSIALATDGQVETEEAIEYGGIQQLSIEEPVNSFQYYTIGMGVMYALFTASTIASRAYAEKQQHVFGRIMLSGTKPLTYLISKLVSGTVFSFLQLVILFVVSTVIFGTFSNRSLEFWLNLMYVLGIYSLVVGSITSLLTSLSLYANNAATVSLFGSLVSVFAFLGGSFTPVEQFSEGLASLGNWTPNGATMTALIQLLQGFSFTEIFPFLGRILGMAVIFIVMALIIFPKRRFT